MAEDTLFYREFGSSTGFSNPVTTPQASATQTVSLMGRVGFGNLVRDYAALNRKNMRFTDNKGYPLCYVVEVEAIGDTTMAHQIELFTAPETWVLKNSVRKWHAARNQMLARMDQLGKVGEYHKTIRPWLTYANSLQGYITPTLARANTNITYSEGGGDPSYSEVTSAAIVGTTMSGGEWTHTKIAALPDHEDQAAANYHVDSYELCVTGDHNNDAGTDSSGSRVFSHVSMMRSYLESRRNASTVLQSTEGQGTIQAEPNPLINLMADSPAIGERKEIVQDMQREKPPYDSFSSSSTAALSGNDSLDLVSKCLLSTSTTYLKDKEVIRVPMGLFHIRSTASSSIGTANSSVPQMRIRLLGIDKCQG